MAEIPNIPEKLARQSADAKATNDLYLQFGDNTALAHLAIFSTAIAIASIELGVNKKSDGLTVRVADRQHRRPFSHKPKIGMFSLGIKAESRTLEPNVVAHIDTRRAGPDFTYIPEVVSKTLLERNYRISASGLLLSSTPGSIGTEKLEVGITATHTETEKKYTGINTVNRSCQPDEFKDLFKLIEEVKQTEDDDSEYTIRTKRDVVVITGDPEKHFNFHSALGIDDQQIGVARANFNAIMQVSDVPYRTNI